MSLCRKSGVGLICLSNFKLNRSKTCQLFLNPLVRWMPTQLAQLFPETKKTSETEPLSRPKSIIWRERLNRRPLAAHNCLQNPQSHICGLLQNLAEQFQLLTAIAKLALTTSSVGDWVVIEKGGGGGTKGGLDTFIGTSAPRFQSQDNNAYQWSSCAICKLLENLQV